MAEEFLSQEEIDSLLGEEKKEEKKEEVAPFDMSTIEQIKKGGVPGLDLIFERWVKSFREEIRFFIPKANMVSKESVYITRFNSFMSKIPLPCSYTIASMKPLKENFLFVLDSRLVFVIVSTLFGGPAKPFKVEGREFTKLETRIINNVANIALSTFKSVWRNIYPVNVKLKSIELNPTLAKIVSSTEKVIVVELTMEIDGYEAPFFFCFPHEMFIPIKEIIYSESGLSEKDPVWEKHLKEKVLSLKLNLKLELGRKTLKFRDIMEWGIGTQIQLNVLKDSKLDLYVENVPKFKAKLGKLGKRYAALITDLSGEDNAGGGEEQKSQ